MWENLKKGIGLAVGWTLGKAIVRVAANRVLRCSANDDAYMKGLKERRPDLYADLKKYKNTDTEKEESVEKEEEA